MTSGAGAVLDTRSRFQQLGGDVWEEDMNGTLPSRLLPVSSETNVMPRCV